MEFMIPPLAVAIGICIGLVYGDRLHRKAVLTELDAERHVLKDALRQMSETHNALVTTQAGIDIRLGDVEQRVNIMLQGVKK